MSAGGPLPYPLDLPALFQGALDLRIAIMTGPGAAPCDRHGLPTQGRGHKAGPHAEQLSRRVLRALLSDGVGGRVTADEWVLTRTPAGRPQVVGPLVGYRVSIAYAGALCVVAAAWGRPVGVDLERLPCRLEGDLPDHLLTLSEIALLRDAPDTFVTIWTLKEALAKERGTGLTEDMSRLDTTPYARAAPGQVQKRPDGGAAFHGHFHHSGQAYALALTLGAQPGFPLSSFPPRR